MKRNGYTGDWFLTLRLTYERIDYTGDCHQIFLLIESSYLTVGIITLR